MWDRSLVCRVLSLQYQTKWHQLPVVSVRRVHWISACSVKLYFRSRCCASSFYLCIYVQFSTRLLWRRLHHVWSNCPKSETGRQDIWVFVSGCFQKVSWSWEIYILFTERLILYLKQELCNRSLFVKCFIIRTPFSNEIFHRKFHLHWQVPGTTAKPIELNALKFKTTILCTVTGNGVLKT